MPKKKAPKIEYVEIHLGDELHPTFKTGVRRFLLWRGHKYAHLFYPSLLRYKRIPLVGKGSKVGLDALDARPVPLDVKGLSRLIKSKRDNWERMDVPADYAKALKALLLLQGRGA